MNLIKLFISFVKIGVFSFGGGYAMIPLMQNEVTVVNNWISSEEFLDMLSVAQITPGPISINLATFVGYKVDSVIGSIVATTAVALPSIVIVLLISYILKKIGNSRHVENMYRGLRPAVLALIFFAAISIGEESILDYKAVIIAIVSVILLNIKRINIFTVIIISGILGLILY